MINNVDQRIKDWIKEVTDIPEVRLSAPSENGGKDSVGLYLLNIKRVPLARGAKSTPLQIFLHYLITTWSDSPERAHSMLGQLVFAAMTHDEFEVETEGVSSDLWRAFGIVPRPGFLLSVPLRKELPARKVPFVRSQLDIRQTPLSRLTGIVVGPNDFPLVGAKVELPQHHLSTHTDQRGEFHFSSVPVASGEKLVRIHAKGKALSVTTGENWGAEEPLKICFNTLEV